MIQIKIDGRVIATERTTRAPDSANAMHDALLALTIGDDSQAMCSARYYVMAACAMLFENGQSAQAFFARGAS